MNEFDQVKNHIRKHSVIHYTFVNDMVEPSWSDEVPTAAVGFDKENFKCVKFIFNRNFWDSISFTEKVFAFFHETLHVIFNHGEDGNEFLESLPKEKRSFTLLNKMQDICINELIMDEFMKGHTRKSMPLLENLCFIDTIFPDGGVEPNKSFEYYYFKYLEMYGLADPEPQTLDQHGFESGGGGGGGETPEDVKDYIDNAGGTDAFEKPGSGYSIDNKADWKKKKIEIDHNTSLDDLFKFVINDKFAEKVTYTRKKNWYGFDRRTSIALASMGDDLILPVTSINKNVEKRRHKILVYGDVSGSCQDYSDHMLHLAANLPEDKYEVDLKVFATYVGHAHVKKINGMTNIQYNTPGQGTSIENVLCDYNYLMSVNTEYDAVFVLTDGMYSSINYKKDSCYSKWIFVYTPRHRKNNPSNSEHFVFKKL